MQQYIRSFVFKDVVFSIKIALHVNIEGVLVKGPGFFNGSLCTIATTGLAIAIQYDLIVYYIHHIDDVEKVLTRNFKAEITM